MTKKFKLMASFLTLCGLVSCGSKTNNDSGSDIDMSKYPNYIEDIDSISYEFGDEEISNPFWKGNTIYNESVLLVKDEETGEISGNLMFKPLKIISVRDYTLKNDSYKLNEDFTIKDNKIIRTENSKIGYRTSAQLCGDDVPEGFRLVDTITNQLTDIPSID